jgi:hypothetical protein
VSLALGVLAEEGRVVKRDGGGWLLTAATLLPQSELLLEPLVGKARPRIIEGR